MAKDDGIQFNVGIFILWLVGAGCGLLFALYGSQDSRLGVIIVGMSLAILALVARGSAPIFEGGPGLTSSIISLYAGMLVVLGTNFALSYEFSFFAQSTSTFYSSVIQNLAPGESALVNGIAIAITENMLIYALSKQFYEHALKPRFGTSITSALLAPVPGSIMFMFIHAGRTLDFYIQAFTLGIVMFVFMFLEVYSDVEVVPYFKIGVPFGIGIHMGLNIQKMGGVAEFVSALNSVQPPLSNVVSMIYVLFWLSILYLAWRILDRTVGINKAVSDLGDAVAEIFEWVWSQVNPFV